MLAIILPSVRLKQAIKCVTSIEKYTDVPHIIFLVAPFMMENKNIIHIEDTELVGVINAVNMAYACIDLNMFSHVTVLSDEVRVTPQWASTMINFITANGYKTEGCFRLFDSGIPHDISKPFVVREQIAYFGKQFAPFFMITTKFLTELKVLFDSEFKNFYADPDLSMRVWSSGGKVLTCPNSWIYSPYIPDETHTKNLDNSLINDEYKFNERWGQCAGFNIAYPLTAELAKDQYPTTDVPPYLQKDEL